MAKVKIVGFESLLNGLGDLMEAETIAKEVLHESGKILENDLKEEIRNATDRGYATGELATSISSTKPMKNRDGYFVAVRPVGADNKGVRNGEKLQYLDHGTSKQQPRPVLQKTVNKAEPECAAKAQEIFNKYVKI